MRPVRAAGSLTGVYATAVFPEEPNYTSAKQGDRPQSVTFLMLDMPICVDAVGDDSIGDDIPSIAAIQVTNCKTRSPPGESVTVRGKLFAGLTGHHHSATLLDCEQ